MKAAVRAKVGHPFRVVKWQFGYQKVRFKGLLKNTAQILVLFALSNLWMARRTLLASAGGGASVRRKIEAIRDKSAQRWWRQPPQPLYLS